MPRRKRSRTPAEVAAGTYITQLNLIAQTFGTPTSPIIVIPAKQVRAERLRAAKIRVAEKKVVKARAQRRGRRRSHVRFNSEWLDY